VIKEEQGTIGTREVIAMLFFSLGSKMSDMTPTLIYQNTKNAGWMVPLISGLIIILLFFLLQNVLKKYPGKGLFEIVLMVFGRKLGLINIAFLFLIALTALVVDSRSHIDAIGTMYFPESPIIVIAFLFLGTSYFIARRGLSTIGIVSWLVFPYLLATILLLVTLVFKDIKLLRLFPILGPGVDVIVKESILKVSVYTDMIFFALLIPFLRKGEKYSNGVTIGTIFSIIQMTIFFIIYIALFDYIGVQRIMYPFHETTRYISLGKYFTNTETFFMALWLVGVIIKFSLYLFFTVFLFTKLLSITQIRPLLLPFTTIAIFVGILPENPVETVLLIRENLLHVTSIYIMLFVTFLWLIAYVKGRKVQ
jgi:spore germination protein KB